MFDNYFFSNQIMSAHTEMLIDNRVVKGEK